MCGSKDVVPLSRIETQLLNSLKFKCQHAADGCQQVLKYEDLKQHLRRDCVIKLEIPDNKPIKAMTKAMIEAEKKAKEEAELRA